MKKKKLCFGLTSTLMLLLSLPTFAAMPVGTVVIGNKAYSLDYANDKTNREEIQDVVAVSDNKIYIKDFTGNWVDNLSGTPVQASVIPAVNYKNINGSKNFSVNDGDSNTSDLSVIFDPSSDQVIAIGQALVKVGTITLIAGSSNCSSYRIKAYPFGINQG